MAKKKQYKFIDLFAGLGGFHVALTELGCKCVFASELRDDLRKLYVLNFPEMEGKTKSGINKVEGDITKVPLDLIPDHDILCAGFPCQPFSQAGKRQGFEDEAGRGTLFDHICKIVESKKENKPRFILLENVSNLKGHDNGNTWAVIQQKLDNLGYAVQEEIISPHQYGYPQHRKRIYIVGIRKEILESRDYKPFDFPIEHLEKQCDINSIIDEEDENITPLSLKTHQQLKVWQEFIDETTAHLCPIPSFPIWAMEFGADYKYEDKAPAYRSISDLEGSHGKLGKKVSGRTKEECLSKLPIYAQTPSREVFPDWKIRYISQNRAFYERNKAWLKKWLKQIETWDNSHQKLEWNCGSKSKAVLKDKIIQFRASGIRVKLPTYSPALNLVGTQVPIIPWIKLPNSCIPNYSEADLKKYGLTIEDVSYGRYLSVKEAAALQGMERLVFTGLSTTRCYEALGNAVNTQVVEKIAKNLLNTI